MHSVDFLIIGQGLAGSLLAYELIKRDKSVIVFNQDVASSASRVAAGLINPVTGHRLNITNDFFNYQRAALPLYKEIEDRVNRPIYRDLKQTRLIKNKGQNEYFHKRLLETKYSTILSDHQNTGDWFSDKSQFPFGAINVSQTGYVNTENLLEGIKELIISRAKYVVEDFDYQDIRSTAKGISYKDYQATAIVFCEGYQALSNPWLKHLPFKPAKGEILTLQPQRDTLTRMLSWGHWLVPQVDGTAKLGSNYIWNDFELTKGEGTQSEFIKSLTDYTGLKASVINHQVGIRPSTKQRVPFIGKLSNLDHAYCFNGLGAKGCLLAPTYARLLADNMLNQVPLSEEVTKCL